MIRRYLPAILLALLALTTGWILHYLERGEQGAGKGQRHTPDFYMEDFVSVTMDSAGLPRRELRARHLVHFPDTDTNELVAPHLVVLDSRGGPWHVVSERGWVSADGDEVLLQGKARIWQLDAEGQRKLEVISRDMRVLVGAQYVETDRSAWIRTPSGEARSVGMRAYLGRERLQLLSQVETHYEPKTHP